MRAAVETFAAEGVEAVAISFMHSPAEPGHERRTRDLVAELMPDAHVTASSDLLPQVRYYDRTSTTVLNAYVGPIITRYLGALTDRLEELAFGGTLLIMQSNGGVATPAEISERAALSLLSGPASGPTAGLWQLAPHGLRDCITMDMGGTSFDVALVSGGEPLLMVDGVVDRWRLALPTIDIHTIGAGGGSIAWLDDGRPAARRPAERGRPAGPRLLRPRRHAADGDRRRPRARVPRRGVVRARRDAARPRARGARARAARRGARPRRRGGRGGRVRPRQRDDGDRGARRRACAAASTRATSRSWSPAAPGRCTRQRSRASWTSARCSCRASRRSSARRACCISDFKHDHVRAYKSPLAGCRPGAAAHPVRGDERRRARHPLPRRRDRRGRGAARRARPALHRAVARAHRRRRAAARRRRGRGSLPRRARPALRPRVARGAGRGARAAPGRGRAHREARARQRLPTTSRPTRGAASARCGTPTSARS